MSRVGAFSETYKLIHHFFVSFAHCFQKTFDVVLKIGFNLVRFKDKPCKLEEFESSSWFWDEMLPYLLIDMNDLLGVDFQFVLRRLLPTIDLHLLKHFR
jgi:hypothetical protein